MCKYEMDPMSIVEDTERTRFCPQTDRWTDGRTDGQTDKVIPVYPPFNFVEAGGIMSHYVLHSWHAIKGHIIIKGCSRTGTKGVASHPQPPYWLCCNCILYGAYMFYHTIKKTIPDSKDHGANMGPTWILSAPGGTHIGPMNLAIRDVLNNSQVQQLISIFVCHPVFPWQ